jgi:hypothetical protein
MMSRSWRGRFQRPASRPYRLLRSVRLQASDAESKSQRQLADIALRLAESPDNAWAAERSWVRPGRVLDAALTHSGNGEVFAA